jgi:tetratricopeptide (TPR) repeat protein
MNHPEIAPLLGKKSWKDQLEVIQLIKAKRLHCPQATLEAGTTLLTSYRSKLKSHEWEVCEDVFIAALQCKRDDWAAWALRALTTRFGKTVRIQRLEAMQHEQRGDVAGALTTYEALLTANPMDSVSWKRKCALLKGSGQSTEAIKELNSYLEKFEGDIEAWEELTEIYLDLQQFSRAAFTYEEAVLMNPYDPKVLLRYAEILYSTGIPENTILARKYAAESILKKQTARGLWVLHQICKHLEGPKADEQNPKLKVKAARLLQAQYEAVGQDISHALG